MASNGLSHRAFQRSELDRSLTRLYSAQVKLGCFDPPSSSPLRSVNWANVSTPESVALAQKIAEEGMVLLKNDDILPLQLPAHKNTTILLLAGWANATTQLQGSYFGNLSNVEIQTIPWYDSLLDDTEALKPDYILYIDATDEPFAEGEDRYTVQWDNLRLDTIAMVAMSGIPTIVFHMGEQCDDYTLLANPNVSAVVWAGYPGMAGGDAIVNVLTGKTAPAGRLPVTQYPAEYIHQVAMTDQSLRPNNQTGNPGRTYRWFDNATIPFGYGLHYTIFSTSIMPPKNNSFDIATLVSSCDQSMYTHVERCPVLPTGLNVNVTNTGNTTTSDFVALAFVTGEYGPTPHPITTLVAYKRLFNIMAGASQMTSLKITIGGLARHDEMGNQILYPGSYQILIDVPTGATWNFTLTGSQHTLDMWPQPT